MIVIGGSLGGCSAVGRILSRLPKGFSAPIAVVLHRHRDSEDMIVPILQRETALVVSEAEDKEPIMPGRVYLCPPDYHLLIDDGCFSLSVDDLVSFARPSIDVLFESAAEWFGRTAVAVVLSGSGADGAAGSRRVTERGGAVLVQDPRTAEGRWMPEAAILASPHCRVLPLDAIAPALVRHLQASRGL